MLQRGYVLADRAPGPFRCLVCQRCVTGTSTGHCPRCGFVPPSAPPTPPPAYWQRTPPPSLVVLAAALLVLAVSWLSGG